MSGRLDKYFAFGAEIVRSLSRMALGVLVARWAGPESYAVFVLLLAVEVIVHTATNSLFAMPAATLAPGLAREERDALLRVGAHRHGAVTLLACVLALPLVPLLARDAGVAVYLGFAATLGLAGVQNYLRTWLSATFRARGMFAAELPSTLLPAGVLALLAWSGGHDLMAAYWWLRALGATVSVLWMLCSVVGESSDAEPPEGTARGLTRMGRHMFLGSLANSVSSRLQPFVLAMVATAADIGVFGAASTFVGPLRMQSVALASVLRPRLALHHGRRDRRAALRAVALGLLLSCGAGLGLTVLFLLAGEELARLVFGEAFAVPLAGVLPWAASYASLAGGTAILAIVLQTVDSAATTARLRAMAGAVSLGLLFPFCAKWGPTGAFSALLFAEVLYAVYGLRRLSVLPRTPAGSSPAAPSGWDAVLS